MNRGNRPRPVPQPRPREKRFQFPPPHVRVVNAYATRVLFPISRTRRFPRRGERKLRAAVSHVLRTVRRIARIRTRSRVNARVRTYAVVGGANHVPSTAWDRMRCDWLDSTSENSDGSRFSLTSTVGPASYVPFIPLSSIHACILCCGRPWV